MVIKSLGFVPILSLCSVFGDALGGNEIDHMVIKAYCHLFYIAISVTILINQSR